MRKPFVLLALIISFANSSYAFQDPTKGKPFVPWLWEDHLQPTINASIQGGGPWIIWGTIGATMFSHRYNQEVFEHNQRGHDLIIDRDTAGALGTLGGGSLSIGSAIAQLFFDQENGLKHSRAIILTATNHVLFALIAARERPAGRFDYLPFKSSFPSGHASNIFATATSLSYAYGWPVGIPMYAIATAVSVARVSENSHWLDDIVAGAGMGIYWAAASYRVKKKTEITFTPGLLPGGGIVLASWEF